MLEYTPPPPEEAIAVVTTEIPHSREAEEAVLGAVFINPECYYEISRIIKVNDFYTHRHGWIWDAFESLANNRRAVDFVTVSEELEKRGVLAEIGGRAYLTSLINQVPNSFNAESYAFIVKGHADRRKGILLANGVAQRAYDEGKAFDLGSEALVFANAASGNGKRIETQDAADEMKRLIDNPNFCTTGIPDLDNKIGGLFPFEVSVLGGYQGTGKSALKIQSARHNADLKKRVLLVDLEMTAAQTWFRMSCGDLGVDMNRVRSNRVSEVTKEEIKNHADELAEQYKDKLVIYQAPMTPSDILSAAMIERPDILYIDTLKNVAGKPQRESTNLWYDFVMNFLRQNIALNKAIGAHVQVLHHINRSTHRENRKPTMHDLMFAGESDTDNVFLLFRKQEDYEVNTSAGLRTVVPITFICDKSRFGWTGNEEINFKLVNQSFYGMTKE